MVIETPVSVVVAELDCHDHDFALGWNGDSCACLVGDCLDMGGVYRAFNNRCTITGCCY